MKKTLALVLVACTSIAVAAPVLADKRPKGMSFSQLDADGNGELTQDEMRARGAARFATVDADGDGFLTVEELEAAGSERAKKRSARMMKHLDADGDGKISQEEMQNRDKGGRMFGRIDADGNGTVSEEEFAAARDKMKKRKKKN
jgi:Ca2+-binding EF-hand superfamily protein